MPTSITGVTWPSALRFWLKLGCISFGGPAGQIAIMHSELVERRRWISEQHFLHALNYCMVLPGPEAQQLATYIGWSMHGVRGGLAAGGLFVLPAFVLLTGIAWAYLRICQQPAVSAVLYGIKPAIIALIAYAAWRIGKRTLRKPLLTGIALASLAASVAGAPFPMILLTAAAIGFAAERTRPGCLVAAMPSPGETVIASVQEPITLRQVGRHLLRVLALFIGLWATLLGALTLTFGWHDTLTQLAWFFTKAALLTFGGAYAVLPYVTDAAVNHYQWLSIGQMLDGLALGETTPGPLIIINTFVGYLAGAGPTHQLSAALIGATIATLFTFLPSFMFIFAGGPFIRSTGHNAKIAAPLAAITAAVVGVIVALAVFFARHVLWHGGGWDALATLIASAALLALIRFQLNVLSLIGMAGLVGYVVNRLAA